MKGMERKSNNESQTAESNSRPSEQPARTATAFILVSGCSVFIVISIDISMICGGRSLLNQGIIIVHIYFIVFSIWSLIEAKRSRRRVRNWSSLLLLVTLSFAAMASITAPTLAFLQDGMSIFSMFSVLWLFLSVLFTGVIVNVWIRWIGYMRETPRA